MRILIALTRADTLGGAQIHVRGLALSLRAAGHDVRIVTGPSGPFNDLLSKDGLETWPCDMLQNAPHLTRDLATLRFLRQAVRRFGPDLVSLHSSKAGLLGRIACKLEGVPAVFTAHSWPFKERRGLSRSLYQHVEALISRLGQPIICVSEDDRRAGLDAGIRAPQLTVVHNGALDAPHRATPGAPGPMRVAFVARLDAPKDHLTVLQALVGLENVQLDLIGDGPLQPALEARAAELGVAHAVRFLGRREDVDALLAESHAFVLASLSEGFPLSTLEAMRAGLPVIVSDVGGAAEAFEDGVSGLAVPAGDAAALRERLAALAANPARRAAMGLAARAHYEAHHTLAAMMAKTMTVYDHALGGMLTSAVPSSQETAPWQAS